MARPLCDRGVAHRPEQGRLLRRRNAHLLPAGFHAPEPVWYWQEFFGELYGRGPDEDGRLAYSPCHLACAHHGRSKPQMLQADPSSAWQTLLIEGDLYELPGRGGGANIGGRLQIETGYPPRRYLPSMPAREVGWTLETYAAAFLTALERSGRLLDRTSITHLVGCCFATGQVPNACWRPTGRCVSLTWDHPAGTISVAGARSAVPVA